MRSAALRKVSAFAGWLARAASASRERQGLCATPPSARPAERMVSPSQLEAGSDGDEREGVALAVARLEVPGVLCEFCGGQSDGGDELAGLEDGVECGVVTGKAMEGGDGDRALAAGGRGLRPAR